MKQEKTKKYKLVIMPRGINCMIVNIFKVNWRGKINSVAERVVIIDLSDLTDLLEEPEVLMMILEKKKHRVMKKQTSSNQFLHVLHDTISILNTGEFLK